MLAWLKRFIAKDNSAILIAPNRQTINIDELMRNAFASYELGSLAKAEKLFSEILATNSNSYEAAYFLGLVYRDQGFAEKAVTLLSHALFLKNDEPEFYKSLGHLLLDLKRKSEAIPIFENALKLDPSCITTLSALFSTYRELGNFNKALEYITIALELAPNCWPALNVRGDILLNCGKVNLAIKDYLTSTRLNPDFSSTFSNYLFALNYSTCISAEEIFAEHKRYDEIHGSGKFGYPIVNIKDPKPYRKLRIGYLSPDFFDHAVSIFIIPILINHDQNNFETFCYHVDKIRDDVTEELKSISNHWRDCFDWSTESIVKKIKNDDIDILIDLAGHTTNSRLDLFAARAAPIQITWLGYINTTGLSAMDYRIVDSNSDPEGIAERYHTEKLLRLPNTQWCFNKPRQLIDVSPLPALTNKFITFGSFNRYSKLSEKILSLWAKLLIQIAGSKLVIADVPEIELESIREFFTSKNININRLEFYGRMSTESFRELHHKVDIGLDSHPYSGGTTTCESLWMGVPTLTLVGETSISRSTSSLMQTLKLPAWITYTEEEFLKAAILHMSDLQKLATLRFNLREQVESSSIMDASQFTKDLENAFRGVWKEKCITTTDV
ncbi:MAG TPA: tetratricopeptide repeat protein [Methylophilaceae bacterium]|nr:tetratricopeptide repeat protein [Methylophilaceae bacterium]